MAELLISVLPIFNFDLLEMLLYHGNGYYIKGTTKVITSMGIVTLFVFPFF